MAFRPRVRPYYRVTNYWWKGVNWLEFKDRTLACRDCGATFIFTAGEQGFYQTRGLVNEPKRCPSCRAVRRQERTGQPAREMHPVICAQCGAPTTVPFVPRNDRPVYCSICFEQMRMADGVR